MQMYLPMIAQNLTSAKYPSQSQTVQPAIIFPHEKLLHIFAARKWRHT